MTLVPSIQAVAEKLVELDRDDRPFADARELRAALELYFSRLKRATTAEDWLDTRRNLVAIAAVCYRGCRDLGLVSDADAIAKDDATM